MQQNEMHKCAVSTFNISQLQGQPSVIKTHSHGPIYYSVTHVCMNIGVQMQGHPNSVKSSSSGLLFLSRNKTSSEKLL